MATYLCHIGLVLSITYLVGSTASRNDFSSPNNINFGLKGMFSLYWEWKPSSANCSLSYVKKMISSRNGIEIKAMDLSSQWEYDINRLSILDLNDKLSLFVEAKCNNMTIDTINRTVELAPGDERTAVKNFHCVWDYPEYVKCTWQHGPNTPPTINYRIFYWIYNDSLTERLYSLAEFWDLLESGSTCKLYDINDVKAGGCKFPLHSPIVKDLAIVITDTSKSIKPSIYYIDTASIVKLKPPEIVEAYRTANNSIHVRWKNSHARMEAQYELLLIAPSDKRNHTYKICDTTIPNVLPDATYTIKVRAKISPFLINNHFTWSDWSKEKILKGNEDHFTFIVISVIFSAIAIIVAVFLLVHMKRLKALICPQIPDPAGIFPKDLQQWLKNDVNTLYSKPEREEICPVYLAEKPPATKYV